MKLLMIIFKQTHAWLVGHLVMMVVRLVNHKILLHQQLVLPLGVILIARIVHAVVVFLAGVIDMQLIDARHDFSMIDKMRLKSNLYLYSSCLIHVALILVDFLTPSAMAGFLIACLYG